MKRVKSTLNDEITLKDVTASAPDKISAARALAFDGFGKQIHSILDSWLSDSKFLLRDEAISLLIGTWGHQKYVPKAIQMLHDDPNWSVRSTSAKSLATFANNFIEGQKYKDQIIKELLISLINDNNSFVQQNSYKGLYSLINKKKLVEDKDYFDRNIDVDWNLLQRYLEKFDLQKPI